MLSEIVVVVFLLLCYSSLLHIHGVSGSRNKHAVKTLKTEYGDTYDCVDILKQPSLDHPSLKNHKSQLRPDISVQKAMTKGLSKYKYSRARLADTAKHECPRGTVPIRRDDVQSDNLFPQILGTGQGAVLVGMHTKRDVVQDITGVAADMSLWNPNVLDNESSGARIAVQSGQGPQRNFIQAGWTVSPRIYGDHNTRMYTIWTADDLHSTGCYNTRCPGFIVTEPGLTLDYVFPNVSKLRGPVVETHLQITKDAITGNWWLVMGYYIYVGYWPRELFTNLGNGASEAQWEGRVYIDPYAPFNDPPPVMGTGDVLEDRYAMSAYFRNVEYWDSMDRLVIPNDTTVEYVGKVWCYFAAFHKYSEEMGFNFLYGGLHIIGCGT